MSNSSFIAKEAAAGTPLAAFQEGSSGKKIPANILVDAAGVDAIGAVADGVAAPAGAAGIVGWLSAVYKAVSGVLNIRHLSGDVDSVTANIGSLNGAASDAAIASLTNAVNTLNKHIAIQNIILSNMADNGETDLRSTLNDQNLLNY